LSSFILNFEFRGNKLTAGRALLPYGPQGKPTIRSARAEQISPWHYYSKKLLYSMPIYEYECCECSERFEFLILRKSDVPVCVKCGSKKLKRLVSSCSVKGSSQTSTSVCSSCSLPSCSSCNVKPSKTESLG